MDKKMLMVYIISAIFVITVITGTVVLILGMGNEPVNICTTSLTDNMARNLLGAYCDIDEKNMEEYITKKGVKEAYLELLNGKSDVVLATEVDDETINWLKANGIDVESKIIAKDAIVFLRNINNPVESLTSNQVRGIFSGKYKNWKELGGNDEDIISYRAKENTEEEYMMEKFMGNKALIKQRYEPEDSSLEGLLSALSEYLDTSSKAITYTTYTKLIKKDLDEIEALRLDEVEPTEATLKKETYGGTMNIYAIIRSNEPEDSQTRKFVEYIISKNGQAVIEQSGYVNLIK